MRFIITAMAILVSGTLSAQPPVESEVQQAQFGSTVSEQSRASAWQLTDSEWQRYRQLQAGPRGIWSPGLDPLTTLGIHAESEADRKRYAEQLVEQEKRRVDQELAFQLAYDEAWRRLYPNLLPIQGGVSPSTGAQAQINSRLLVFVSTDCLPCDAKISLLQRSAVNFDVFVVGTAGDDQKIRAWATKVGIKPERVRSREITLNHDSGQWMDLAGLDGELPGVFKREGGQWLPASE